MPLPRIPTADQLCAIRIQALRYLDVRRRLLEPHRPGDQTNLGVAWGGLKEAFVTSQAACPYGWPQPVREALATVGRELAPGGSAVAGYRDNLERGHIVRRYAPPIRGTPVESIARQLDALEAAVARLEEAAVAELERAVSGDTGVDAQPVVSPSSPEPKPERTAEPHAEPADDEEVWGPWISMSIDGLVKAMGYRGVDSAHAVITGMETAGTIQIRRQVNVDRDWKFRIMDHALRRRVLKYIADPDEAAIADELRKEEMPKLAAIVEFMNGKPSASEGDVAEFIYGDPDPHRDRLRKSIGRLNRFLEGMPSRLNYRLKSSRLFKEVAVE